MFVSHPETLLAEKWLFSDCDDHIRVAATEADDVSPLFKCFNNVRRLFHRGAIDVDNEVTDLKTGISRRSTAGDIDDDRRLGTVSREAKLGCQIRIKIREFEAQIKWR